MANHIFILAFVMLIAGVFGGLINFYQMNQNNNADPAGLPRCIVMGVGAAFLVPVILNLVNSELIQEIQGDPSRLLIYTGYCLIASVASRLVITNNEERILREAAQARMQSEAVHHNLRQMQEELLPLIDTETEQDVEADGNQVPLEDEPELDVVSAKVLKTLGCGRYIFRSLAGLCHDSGADETTMTKTLQVLVARNLAGKVSGAKGVRWYVTERGRRLMDSLA